MVERGDGAGFLFEAFAELFAGGLYRDNAVETGIARFPDDAHSARACLGKNLIGT
jgi:hypothetical protein